MSKFNWIILAAFLAFTIFLFKDQLLSSNGSNTLFNSGVEVEVKFSVIRYNGKAVSVRLVTNGSGELESRHKINADEVGVDYYKHKNTVDKIESKPSQRFLPKNENGFSSDVVIKKISVE